jgi:hypothetical protein
MCSAQGNVDLQPGGLILLCWYSSIRQGWVWWLPPLCSHQSIAGPGHWPVWIRRDLQGIKIVPLIQGHSLSVPEDLWRSLMQHDGCLSPVHTILGLLVFTHELHDTPRRVDMLLLEFQLLWKWPLCTWGYQEWPSNLYCSLGVVS